MGRAGHSGGMLAVAATRAAWVAGLLLSGCGGEERSEVAGEESELGRLVEESGTKVESSPEGRRREASDRQARDTFRDFWARHGGAFRRWRGSLEGIYRCGIENFDSCVELRIEVEVEGTTIRLEQVKLAGAKLLDEKGTEGFAQRGVAPEFRTLRATSPLLRDFALATTGNLVGSCVLASGRAHPVVQSEDVSAPRFFVEFSALEPCDGEGRAFAMPATLWELRRELARLRDRYDDAHGPEARVFYAAARHVERGYLGSVGHRAPGWEGTLASLTGEKGESISFSWQAGDGSTDTGRLVPFGLFGTVPASQASLYDSVTSAREGDCVRVWGDVETQETSLTESGAMTEPVHHMTLSRMERCPGARVESTE